MLFKTRKRATILLMLGTALGLSLMAIVGTSSAGLAPLMTYPEIREVANPLGASECQPVLDALDKLYTTPYHSYMTQTGIEKGKTVSMETVFAGGIQYVLYNGKWSPSPLSTEEMKELVQRNRKNAKNLSCRFVRDEVVNGEGAALYNTHEDTKHGKSDNQIWVSKNKGLILRQETELDTGGANGKSHVSVRYEYSNVQAPKL
jgi:hypothetical protein